MRPKVPKGSNETDENWNRELECLNLCEIEKNPYCRHGPTIVFKKVNKTFYACSACRDRKECSFYAEYDEKKSFSKEKLDFWLSVYKDAQKSYIESYKMREKAFKTKEPNRSYCQTCYRFVLNERDIKDHLNNHKLLREISDKMLKRPILEILEPIVSNSSNAQFIFDHKTAQFILGCITKFGCDSLLCVGCPSIFERSSELNVNRLLLDIDERFAQFYGEDKFIKYNMFNGHFFAHKPEYLRFLKNSKKIFVLVDPPYGGLVQLIANTIESIRKDLDDDKQVSIFLIYPYFISNWIENWLPDFKMCDYKVSYGNQKKFSTEKTVKKGSPARIFTNMPLKDIQLPESEGYTFCSNCKKFTFEENIHCDKCKLCPSKDGGFYKHCDKCERCVKASYEHCGTCKQCHLEGNCHKDKRKCESEGNEVAENIKKRKS